MMSNEKMLALVNYQVNTDGVDSGEVADGGGKVSSDHVTEKNGLLKGYWKTPASIESPDEVPHDNDLEVE